MRHSKAVLIGAAVFLGVATGVPAMRGLRDGVDLSAEQLAVPGRAGAATPVKLSATAHPPVPGELSAMWLVPAQSAKLSPALSNLVRGVKLIEEDEKPAAALPLVSDSALASTALADYAKFYTGLALLKLERYAEADAALGELAVRDIDGHLPEDAAFLQAEIREAQDDHKGAVRIYESLVTRKLARPQLAWLRLGVAAEKAGQPMRSVEALQRAYYDYPTTAESDQAGDELDRQDVEVDETLAPKELARAETLFHARRWANAKASYASIRSLVTGADRDRVSMRIAASDVALGRYRDGREALRPMLKGPQAEEATFHYITAVRGLGLKNEHRQLARAYADQFPTSAFAEEILNHLASAYIIDDEDADADAVFREMLERFPAGRFAERAAWKAGWTAYRDGRFADALRYFDKGSAQFPRSDYRPSWLYWAGRAAEQAGDVETGIARLRLAATDYHNSYYGRLAVARLKGARGAAITPTLQKAPATADIPTASRIATLLSVGLNRQAMDELLYAQRMWGDSPPLQATIAVTHQRLGNVRAGINAMKRAYPQYLAAGGETLPAQILQVIFPIEYWPLLQKYSKQRGLDPFVVAALVAQESNFDAGVRSHANAYGLMQILPSTGRQYARRLGVRPFSTRRLTDAEINVRLGTQIFADSIKKFGGLHYALAAYNAGDSRVIRWRNEKPGLPQDEFIDDIPFPETQNYVKRILGTAEDYRYLYSSPRDKNSDR
jgi:soluble lytic murein transglycosylase